MLDQLKNETLSLITERAEEAFPDDLRNKGIGISRIQELRTKVGAYMRMATTGYALTSSDRQLSVVADLLLPVVAAAAVAGRWPPEYSEREMPVHVPVIQDELREVDDHRVAVNYFLKIQRAHQKELSAVRVESI